MIASELDYRMHPDEHEVVSSTIGTKSYKFYCLKTDKAKLDNILLAIQRLVSRFIFKYPNTPEDTIIMYCIVNILSSKNTPEENLQEKKKTNNALTQKNTLFGNISNNNENKELEQTLQIILNLIKE